MDPVSVVFNVRLAVQQNKDDTIDQVNTSGFVSPKCYYNHVCQCTAEISEEPVSQYFSCSLQDCFQKQHFIQREVVEKTDMIGGNLPLKYWIKFRAC